MGILDGQAVNAAVTNPAFINKNQDDSMSNKLTFSRALSGATVSDIQAAVNKLYNATGASEIATGTVYNAPANTITDGDSHQTALTELADKFHPATGHMHTGTAGDAPPLPGSSISDVPFVQFVVAATPITAVTGSSWNVTTEMTGKSPSTGATDLGVVVTNPQNRIFLASSNAGTLTDCFVDATGNLVYGRLTESTGTWTLNFYSLIFGAETAYSFTSPVQIQWYFHELYEPLVSTPVYEPDYFDFEFRTVKTLAASGNSGIFGDVVIAASGGVNVTQFGQTLLLTGSGSFSDATPQDVGATGNAGIATSTSRSDHVHKGLHSIAASGYSQIFGDATLLAGSGMTISATGNTIQFIATATGGGTTSPLTTKGDLYGFDTDNNRVPVGASGQCLIADSNAVLGVRYQDQIPKNFILESDAELATTVGWATYADAAGTSPVDGTGGSPNITFAATGTNPIAGFYSYLITKDAANRQGQGVSYDFTIDRALLGKVVQASFDYEPGTNWVASSGGIGFSDISMYCYDITNAILVPIQPLDLTSGVGIQGTWMGEFQTNVTSQNYRLIAHIATTNANAWTFKFDNVYVGVPERAQGTPVTDWVAYTPTFVGFGTVSNVFVYSKRVGDTLEVIGKVTVGTPTGVTASMTLGFNGANANVTWDSSKAPVSSVIGHGATSTTAGATWFGVTTVLSAATSGNVVNFGEQDDANKATTAALGSTLIGSNQVLEFSFKIPISGWSSQTEMSSQADTRVVAATTVGSTTSLGTSAVTLVPTTITIDTHAGYNGSGVYTVPVSGLYDIGGTIQTSTSTTYIQLYYRIDGGSNVLISSDLLTTTGTFNSTSGSTVIPLIARQTIEIRAITSTTATADAQCNTFIVKRSGPATIASSETVVLSALRNSGDQTISAGIITVVGLDAKSIDTHNTFNTSTGKYRLPASGRYRVSYGLRITNTTSPSSISTYVLKNDTGKKYASWFVVGNIDNGTYVNAVGSSIIEGIAGDLVTLYIDAQNQNVTLKLSVDDSNDETIFMTINRIGL